MRKFIGFVAVAVMAAFSAAGVASASSNLANGTVVTATNTGTISFGSVISCEASTLKGTLTNNAAGAGATITVNAAANASFTNCTNSTTITTQGTWTITTAAGGPTVWNSAWDNVDLIWDFFGVQCRYAGNVTGGNYSNSSEKVTLGGSLAWVSGGFPCPTGNQSWTGVYDVSPTLQLS